MKISSTRSILALVAVSELLVQSLWFSGTAVLPQLAREWHAGIHVTSWLTIAVQLGFVLGAVLAAVFNLSDIFSAARVFAFSALAGAAFNAGFALAASRHQIVLSLVLRCATGMALAGTYPTAMRLLAGWFREGRGTALGLLIAALTVGSALPHAVHAIGDLPWRAVVMTSSILAVCGAVVLLVAVRDGPYSTPAPRLDVRQLGRVLHDRALLLANCGYLGHMWELYSMWAWIAIILGSSSGAHSSALIEGCSFVIIAVGAVGCLSGGRVSDRLCSTLPWVQARSVVTIVAMTISGTCCLLAALTIHRFPILVGVCLIWGVAIIADSAQFSTVISELADQRYVGTTLTIQTAAGFSLTALSIWTTGWIGAHLGWRCATLSMAVGPLLGSIAMFRLKRLKLAE